jgi:hypothetical protein
MTKLFAFGDSFIVGDQDDFTNLRGLKDYNEHIEFLKTNISFVSLLAKHYNLEYHNFAVRGSGNFPQIDKILQCFDQKMINEGDVILFGITTLTRDRVNLLDHTKVKSWDYGPTVIDRDLVPRGINDIMRYDLFYILSVLDRIRSTYKVKILAFNIFDNLYSWCGYVDLDIYDFDFLLGGKSFGNTLVDIVNDSWGKLTRHPYHDRLIAPDGYERFYTKNKHFSVAGHCKVFEWFVNEKIIDKLIYG